MWTHAALGVIVALWSTPAASQSVLDEPVQPPAEVVEERLQDLREQVKRAYRDGRYEDALRALREAWALRQTGDIAANLARVELTLGRYVEAAEHYRYALDHVLPETTEEQRQAMRADLAEAKAHVATLRIKVTPPDANLLVGDTLARGLELPSELYVEPGSVEVAAVRTWWESARWSAEVAAGTTHDVVLELTPMPSTSPAPPPPPSPAPTSSVDPPARRRGPDTAVLLVGGGLTAVSLGAHLFFKVKYWEADDHRLDVRAELPSGDSVCYAGTQYPEQCAALRDAVETQDQYAVWSDTTLVATGVFAVATLGYLTWTLLEPASSSPVAVSTGLGSVEISGKW